MLMSEDAQVFFHMDDLELDFKNKGQICSVDLLQKKKKLAHFTRFHTETDIILIRIVGHTLKKMTQRENEQDTYNAFLAIKSIKENNVKWCELLGYSSVNIISEIDTFFTQSEVILTILTYIAGVGTKKELDVVFLKEELKKIQKLKNHILMRDISSFQIDDIVVVNTFLVQLNDTIFCVEHCLKIIKNMLNGIFPKWVGRGGRLHYKNVQKKMRDHKSSLQK